MQSDNTIVLDLRQISILQYYLLFFILHIVNLFNFYVIIYTHTYIYVYILT